MVCSRILVTLFNIYQAKQKWIPSLNENNLNLDGTQFDHSFGITGVTLENTFGFKMDLENFQTANANLEVSINWRHF